MGIFIYIHTYIHMCLGFRFCRGCIKGLDGRSEYLGLCSLSVDNGIFNEDRVLGTL